MYMSINRFMDKEIVELVCIEILLSNKTELIHVQATFQINFSHAILKKPYTKHNGLYP